MEVLHPCVTILTLHLIYEPQASDVIQCLTELREQAMGDKLQARRLAEECGVPCVPGTEQAS